MKASGPKHEQETIINFNEEDAEATIWTASSRIYRKLLKRIGSDYLVEDGERHAAFRFPMNFIDLPRKKLKKQLSEGQRAILSDRAKLNLQRKAS